MADDKSKQDVRDRAKVSSSEDYELDHIAHKYGVSRDEVRDAIEKMGNDRKEIEAYFEGRAT